MGKYEKDYRRALAEDEAYQAALKLYRHYYNLYYKRGLTRYKERLDEVEGEVKRQWRRIYNRYRAKTKKRY